MNHVVTEGQDIFDVTIQRYGQLDNLFDLLTLNPEININSNVSSADILVYDATDKGSLKEKTYLKKITFTVMNADEDTLAETVGDYNNDYNNDYFN